MRDFCFHMQNLPLSASRFLFCPAKIVDDFTVFFLSILSLALYFTVLVKVVAVDWGIN